ncbi:MAG: sigma-54 dependent transcriptional regulator [Proteobacteria bacterium]|nr:sigma-54 dependent transcriptional regulator [Pseudomonadota bacterium]MBU1715100.1 sigma-54 dependent transcriptional regulator [Pseudomonadota bacterium]
MGVIKHPTQPILLVDDEKQVLVAFAAELRLGGFNNIMTCDDSRRVVEIVATEKPALLLLDLSMPGKDGREVLAEVTEGWPEIPVVMITAVADTRTAVDCIKAGAFDYLTKPMEEGRLVTTVDRALAMVEIRSEISSLRERMLAGPLNHPEVFADTITTDPTMLGIFRYIESVAQSMQPLLITGETGTGKELIAQATHNLSGRDGAFVRVNVAGVDDNIFADTLFGHRKGAFTGADSTRRGMIEQARGGTLFLDEIGDLSQISQVKLLTLLQEGEYFPLGQDTPVKTDVRIIVATHRNLPAQVEAETFRRDLYYRLQTHLVHLPPLRKRTDDLPLLVEHFLTTAATSLKKRKPTPPRELYQLLGSYHFPGNIRELRSMVFDAVSRHQSGVLSLIAFKDHMRQSSATLPNPINSEIKREEGNTFTTWAKLPTLKEANEKLVSEALHRADGNLTVAADTLGLSRQALAKRLKRGDQ